MRIKAFYSILKKTNASNAKGYLCHCNSDFFTDSNAVLVLLHLCLYIVFCFVQATSHDLHGAGREGEGEKAREKIGGRGNAAAGHMGEVHHPHQTPGKTAAP